MEQHQPALYRESAGFANRLARILPRQCGAGLVSAVTTHSRHRRRAIRKSTVNLLGAAALVAAGLALLRQGNQWLEPAEAKGDKLPPGEKFATDIRLERLRELGI